MVVLVQKRAVPRKPRLPRKARKNLESKNRKDSGRTGCTDLAALSPCSLGYQMTFAPS